MADLNSTIVRGNLRVTEDITSQSLELSHSGIVNGHFIIKDGSLDLSSSSAGIAFNTQTNITNIQAGWVVVSPSNSSGSTDSRTVAFKNYDKGLGNWYVVATAGAYGGAVSPEAVNVTVTNISSSGFTVKGKRLATGSTSSNPATYVYYIAIKCTQTNS